ncbi:MAG: hypothetical protein ACRBCL_03170 [Maritimibacter sp.]
MTVSLGHNWVLGGAALLALAGAWYAYQPDGQVAGRVYIRFVLFVALPLLCLGALALAVIKGLFPDLDERIWAALIAGGVIAGGWLTTAIFAQLDRAQDKAERLRDTHKALFAEIRHTLEALYGGGEAEEIVSDILARMEDDPEFAPFVPREHHDRVYLDILNGINVLPRQTIDPIVAYYSLISGMQSFAEDMRGPRFQRLEQPRRIAMYRDYALMRVRAYELGTYALKLIEKYSESEAAADAFIAQSQARGATAPSSPDADLRDLKQERV